MLCVRGGMRWAVVAAVTLVVSPSSYAQQNPALPGVQMIELDGRAVRVQTIGLEDRRPGAPVIVFEAGASNSLEIWGGLLPRVASMAPVVAYDRAGLGRSEWDGTHVADVMRLIGVECNLPHTNIGHMNGSPFQSGASGFIPALTSNANPTVSTTPRRSRCLCRFSQSSCFGAPNPITGLALSPYDFNLWHPTYQRQNDPGHNMGDPSGLNTSLDKTLADPARLPRVPPGMPIGMDDEL